VRLTWTPGADQATNTSGIEGVLILRADGLDRSAPPVLDQAYYSTTSTIGPNQIVSGGVTWTVVSNLNPSSPFTDASSSSISSYTYAIYMRDRAYNYSAAAVVNYDACSVTPTITTTLAATSIDATGASSGGQTLSAGTGCAISAKGVCWNTSGAIGGASPTVADSKTNDGSGPSDFNSTLSNLQPQTLYYVRAYATNQRGTSYGSEISFRTMSPELTAHPDNFSALASCSNITLRFSALNTITNAFGYLILQRIGGNPTGVPTDRTAYTVGGTIGDGTVVAIVTNQTAITHVLNSVSANTQYFYSIIPFSYDGTNAVTYNYYTTATIKTSNTSLCNAYYINDASTTGDVWATVPGNNTLDGRSPSTPKATLTNLLAAYQLKGGDTVYIDNGNYTESFVIDGRNPNVNLNDEGSLITASPFAANYLVFKGAGSAKTTFTSTSALYNIYIQRAKYIWIEGINFKNTSTSASISNIDKEYGESSVIRNCKFEIDNTSTNTTHDSYNISFKCFYNTVLDAKRTLISNNVFTNNNPNGIAINVVGDVDFSRFENNNITMTGEDGRGLLFIRTTNTDETPGGSGIYWPIADTIVRNRIIANNNGIEITSSNTGQRFWDYLIESNNITINNDASPRSSIYLLLAGLDNDDDIEIKKNVLKGGYSGVYIFNYGEYLKIHNNYICSKFGLYSRRYEGSGSNNANNGVNKENEFLHNSLYTTESCLYFDQGSQDDWDIRNNILYTTAGNSSACIEIRNTLLFNGAPDALFDIEWTNGNLFYRPGGAQIAIVNTTNYSTLPAWQAIDLCSGSSTNDLNSIDGIAPPYENPSNCDLDLVKDMTNWGSGSCGGYPNWNCIAGLGVDLRTTINSDIKDAPARTFGTIGAWEMGSSMAGILPVNLLAFNARLNSQRVLLDWQTANEQNSDYFDVEKSKDGRTGWSFVSRVKSKGNSNSRVDYQSVDHRPYGGVSYYRLRMVDEDGKISYSPIRKINNDLRTISVYPNPAADYANIDGLDKNKSNMIHLVDVTGKLIQEHYVRGGQLRLNITDLPPGVYYLTVNGDQHFQLVKRK